MSPRDSRLRLNDILTATGKIFSFIGDMSEEEFCADEKTIAAVIQKLEVVGEAASRVSEDIQAKYPDVPWQVMKAQRNFLAHVYFGVNPSRIWDTVQNSLPPVVLRLHVILDELEKEE